MTCRSEMWHSYPSLRHRLPMSSTSYGLPSLLRETRWRATPRFRSCVFSFPHSFRGHLSILPTGRLLIVFVVAANPEWPAAILIPTFWHYVQVVIMDVEDFIAARVTRVAVENLPALILIEHAVPFPLGMTWVLHGVVEKGFFLRHFFRSKRHVIVEIEICATGGHPGEIPAHPFLVGCQFLVGSARHADHGHVAMLQMHINAVEAVSPQGAMWAS